MRLRFLACAALLVAVPAVMAAGRSTREQIDAIEIDLRSLQVQVQELKTAQEGILQSLASMRDALALDSPGRRTPADLAARIDSVETDLRVLLENQNDGTHRLAVLTDKVDGLYRRPVVVAAPMMPAEPAGAMPAEPALPLPLVDEEQVGGRDAAAAPGGGEAPALPDSPAAGADAPLVDPEELYQAARADYGRGSYDTALAGFQEFLALHPRSELADNALYWVGECHYSAGRLEDSLVAFDAVVARFPDADKAPDAGYKKGLALLELDRTAEGIVQLQHVKDTWPTSPAGRLARTKLQSLGLL